MRLALELSIGFLEVMPPGKRAALHLLCYLHRSWAQCQDIVHVVLLLMYPRLT